MVTRSQWIRVSRSAPCVICKRTDWCTHTEDGAICCMRVESDKPMRNGGYLHRIGEGRKELCPVIRKPSAGEFLTSQAILTLLNSWEAATPNAALIAHASELGVEPIALKLLGACWATDHRAWAFPMKNGKSETVGVRFRNVHGDKWALRSSHAGLFIPKIQPKPRVYICEGPTDTAAALTIGLYSIGRPSCVGCEDMVIEFLHQSKTQEVVIVADHDEPGQKGAERLQERLKQNSTIWTPAAKDMRAAVAVGIDLDLVEATVKDLKWRIKG